MDEGPMDEGSMNEGPMDEGLRRMFSTNAFGGYSLNRYATYFPKFASC